MHSKIASGSKSKRARDLYNAVRDFPRVAPSETDDVIHLFLQSLDCPRSLAIWLLYVHKEHEQLLELEVSVSMYSDMVAFRDAYIATEYLSKAKFLTLPFDRTQRAITKFESFELQCKRTNNRFMNLQLDPTYHGINATLLSATQRKIAHILGDLTAEEIFDQANWGPGVTTLMKGEHVSSVNKFHSENGITRDMYSLIGDAFPVAYPLWANHLRQNSDDAMLFSIQVGNIIVTVPKNAKTDRVIAIEPGINLFFQKAIGTSIRRRLLRTGVDLNHQSFNQQLARQGSISDELATVDFSSASDSISRLVVRELLPPRWFAILDRARSTVGFLGDKLVSWEKFSSMGNGFTFELESLIFYAAASAVAEHLGALGDIYIHGDDVILPSSAVDLFSSFCAFLGFSVNKDKTHVNSPFRESCGEHWYEGSSCKPIYLKDRLRSVDSIFKLANSIRLLAHRLNFSFGCDHRFRSCWVHLFRRVPRNLRFRTPFGKGDVGFISDFDESAPARSRNYIEGYNFIGLTASAIKSADFEGEGLLLSSLWARSIEDPVDPELRDQLCKLATRKPVEPPLGHRNTYALRGRSRLRVTEMHTVQWYDLGAWTS